MMGMKFGCLVALLLICRSCSYVSAINLKEIANALLGGGGSSGYYGNGAGGYYPGAGYQGGYPSNGYPSNGYPGNGYPGGSGYGNGYPGSYPQGAKPGCPLCDSSVYPYCSEKMVHDACCCDDPRVLQFHCRAEDCSFLNANSCREHHLITSCCCDDLNRLNNKK